jgi:hypothetical protein
VLLHQVARVMGVSSWRGLFTHMLDGPVVYAAAAQAPGFQHAFSVATALLYTAVGFVIVGVVWLLGHCFDVLALLSPFPFVDFILKAIRTVVFAVLLGASIINPHLGLALCLIAAGCQGEAQPRSRSSCLQRRGKER